MPETVRSARARFFSTNDFPADGGYHAAWSEAPFGPVRYRVPNPPVRAAALRLHDLHHVATGYATDWRGESEISGWELGSGGGTQAWGLLIALWGVFVGLFGAPIATWRAFLRGRRSRNLYRFEFDERLLDLTVEELRAALAVPPAPQVARSADLLAFGLWGIAALMFGMVALPASLALVALAAAGPLLTNARSFVGCLSTVAGCPLASCAGAREAR